ncbi:carbon-nitrogen hydrolase family protein [Mycetocola zhadangensis]|uniref:Carbon-nitrogen hydrolase family protein n=1 Tax=Mycetocola zhadangensis TaxID=1164595 RepID=A0A3L7J4X5_9MICO|nr:carbon-nitrogen hydrolase family protein [Mycetocola zhadangensis]RLQ85746.1 carbon-nitrogen hydrolase family protein [Mycetocola zhadangensis]GGE85411.1 hydrolase [Mycetocola zhadangensis]
MIEHAPVGIAIAQFSPTADVDANLTEIRQLAERAAERGAAVVVFPEYSSVFVDPMGPELVARAQPIDGEFVETIAGFAQDLGIHLVAGMAERRDTTRFSNTIVALSPQAELVATYRKQHLYDAFGQTESNFVVPGELTEPETFVAGGLRFGIQTCYDIRFPEVTRRIVDAGADVVLVPSEWVRGPLKEHHWRTLVTARAIENTVYVAGADHTPPIGVGNSLIVDPSGVQIAGIGIETDVAVAFASASHIADVRLSNPALALRRFRVVPNE